MSPWRGVSAIGKARIQCPSSTIFNGWRGGGCGFTRRPASGGAHLAIERGRWRVRDVAAAQVVPTWRARRAWLGGLALVAMVVGGVALAPRLFEAQWLRWTGPFGEHRPYSRVVYHLEPGAVR